MTAIEALAVAQAAGVEITLRGDNLVLDAERKPASDVLTALKHYKGEIVSLLRAGFDGWSADDWRVFFDERAGIAEFGGNQSRRAAEALAFECCVTKWMNQHPIRSDPHQCVACGRPEREEHAVVPFGTENLGHAWLHPECWQDWHESRRAAAISALAAMGIKDPAAPIPGSEEEGE